MSSKILLFGTTGGTGQFVCKAALENGHDVIAFVRNVEKLNALMIQIGVDPDLAKAHLFPFEGDLEDTEKVRKAVTDTGLSKDNGDVIIYCAGRRKSCSVLYANPPMNIIAVNAVVDEMRKKGLKRILYQGGAMSVDKRLYLDPMCCFKTFMVHCLSPLFCIKDMVVENARVTPFIYTECDDIEWIYTRPGWLLEGESRLSDKLGFGVTNSDAPCRYCDIGAWTAKAVFDEKLIHTTPYIGYVRK